MGQKEERAPSFKIVMEDLVDKGKIIFFLLYEFQLIYILKIIRHSILLPFSVFNSVWMFLIILK